jgi:TonB family protein
MGYQALLFCPDEKTARSVTQVLNELDFTVIPCTEPFGAVKKLMSEHFDAVVVDCDNEQNATLLFKSARNTPNNQSSLAVAVVEGQAGVAKAFRIGANLVLTKPINVEQSKGTLRVARGLLRKNEAGKPAAPVAGAAVKPAGAAPAAPKPTAPKPAPPAPNTRVATARPAAPGARPAAPVAPVAPLAKTVTASIPTQKPAPQPPVVASVPTDSTDADAEILEVGEEAASPSSAKPKMEAAASHSGVMASTPSLGLSQASSAGFGSSAASAPAPAREPKPNVSTEDKPSPAIPEPDSKTAKAAEPGENTASIDGTSAPAPSATAPSAPAPGFTFGGNVSSDAEVTGSGSKKRLLAVAAVVLVAAGGCAVWMQWVRSSGAATPFTQVATPPVTHPAVVPHVAPSAAPVAPSTAPAAATPFTQAPTPESATAPPQDVQQTSSDTQTASAESASVHPSKVSAKTDSAKPAASAPAANKAAASKTAVTKAVAEPIVIKNDLSQKTAAKSALTADAPPPSMTGIAPADSGGSLPNLVGDQSSAPTPVLQTLNLSQGVSQGLLVKKTQPIYPENAMRMHVEGPVELLATISKTGNISAVKILSGDPQLARAAVDAVKQWKYKPYLLNGEPVEIQTQVTVNFKLPN